MSRSTF